MSYKTTLGWLDVWCDTPREAIALCEGWPAYVAAQRGPRTDHESSRRAIVRRFARITRQQRAREAADLGYLELGGEAGGA